MKYLSHFILTSLSLLTGLFYSAVSYGTTITVGQGAGIIWSGLPFSYNETHNLDLRSAAPRYGIVAISDIVSRCMPAGSLTEIGGYQAYQIAPGIGIIPIANVSAAYWQTDDKATTLSGTIGIPDTTAITSAGETIRSSAGYDWCIPPGNITGSTPRFFAKKERTASVNGYWAVVTDGMQKSSDIRVRPMYFGSFTAGLTFGDIHQQIFPSDITFRVTNLHCNLDTPTLIDFGSVAGNLNPDAQLAVQQKPFVVQCTQDIEQINANLNVQFRAVSSLYQGNIHRLSLTEGGGYITGEIGKGVTGSGQCRADNGVKFDNTQINVGNIAAKDNIKVIRNDITWRLCSGGADLPFGDVHAAAEILVTFN